MGKTFYIADTHFGHKNIINFDNRPFSSTKEMEDIIVKNWNSVVTRNDDVYILGDFCWDKEDEWIRILNRLNGRKFLIKGNHDLRQMSQKLKNMFHDIKDYKEIKDGNRHIILCHYPILFYRGSYNDAMWHFHGHTHNRTEEEYARNDFVSKLVYDRRNYIAEYREPSYLNRGHIVNVGCMMECMGYTPRTADELIKWWHDNYGV